MEKTAKKVRLNVEGMTCANCAQGISRKLKDMKLEDVNVDFASGEVLFSPVEDVEVEEVVGNINKMGYKVVDSEEESTGEKRKKKLSRVEKLFITSLVFALPLFAHMFVPHDFILNNPYVQLGLCLPVMVIGTMYFGKSAWSSMKMGIPNMDVLITIGSTAAFIYSLVGTIQYAGTPEVHNYLFYETAATIITLVLLGNVLEHRSVKQTTTAIKELSEIQKVHAKQVVETDGKEEIVEIPYDEIAKGDVLKVNSGDKVPVDGEIVWGDGSLDESMISGESLAVDKSKGDEVIGGTLLESGSIKMKATRVGEETVLSQIIEMVRNAQQSKPSIQRLGDKVSAVFVPVVVGIALLTFLVSWLVFNMEAQQALMNSIAVLVISCPCAMGLATPTAVMVGIGRAAKKGILIKGGATLEEFAKVDTVIFDKTGTLTTGDFSIKKIHTYNGMPQDEAANIIYSMEQHSSHPIAKSITTALKEKSQKVDLNEVEEQKGVGISAKDQQGNAYQLGSYRVAETLTKEDQHHAYLVKNDELIAAIDLDDELQDYARETIDLLHKMGKETVLLSGDKKERCEEVAQKLGIKKVYSEQKPEQKLEVIEKLKKQGKVAMVGDGINDAPALTKADVGISLSEATEVAIQSASVVLLSKEGLGQFYKALLLSKHTLTTIKQNLFWAFFYNVIAIPIAAVGLLNPMIAALSMAFSDVIVIGNSIRLRYKKIF